MGKDKWQPTARDELREGGPDRVAYRHEGVRPQAGGEPRDEQRGRRQDHGTHDPRNYTARADPAARTSRWTIPPHFHRVRRSEGRGLAGTVGQVRFFGSRRRNTAGDGDRAATGPQQPEPRELDDDELRAQVEGVLLRELTGGLDDPSSVPEPLTRDRVVEWLGENGFSYFVDSEGDVGGLWHGWLFYFLMVGESSEVLQVRGQWHRDLTIERLEEILELCNEWNAERIWPKTYVRVRDNGAVLVYTEVTVDLEHGVTEDQLDQLLQCGLTTGSMFFEHLDETFPDPLRSAP